MSMEQFEVEMASAGYNEEQIAGGKSQDTRMGSVINTNTRRSDCKVQRVHGKYLGRHQRYIRRTCYEDKRVVEFSKRRP